MDKTNISHSPPPFGTSNDSPSQSRTGFYSNYRKKATFKSDNRKLSLESETKRSIPKTNSMS